LSDLGINPALLAKRNLPLYEDATNLVVADVSQSGREHMLVPEAAKAWMQMRNKAFLDGISIIIISAFRSFDRQVEIVKDSLRTKSSETVFKTSAPPGYSEHHSGCAIDIGTMGCEPLSQEFADTKAFTWLQAHALEFGFALSYPMNNSYGFKYEPWHWCYHGKK